MTARRHKLVRESKILSNKRGEAKHLSAGTHGFAVHLGHSDERTKVINGTHCQPAQCVHKKSARRNAKRTHSFSAI
jgi:hypothetical protein